MSKVFKQLAAAALAVALTASALPGRAFSGQIPHYPDSARFISQYARRFFTDSPPEDRTDLVSGVFHYRMEPEGAVLTGYSGSASVVQVPDTLGGLPVTGIGPAAFRDCTTLQQIYLPDTVTAIGDRAFQNCTNLSYFQYPLHWKTAGPGIFSGCRNLATISVPEGVTALPRSAFEDADCLSSATLPQTLTSIGAETFRNCSGLLFLRFPARLRSIDDRAFLGCTSLKKADLSETALTTLGSSAFQNCDTLWLALLPGSETPSRSLTHMGASAFEACPALTEITLPASLTALPSRTFFGCTGLQEAYLPDSLSAIGPGAFGQCPALTDLYYSGSAEQWANTEKGPDNEALAGAVLHCGTDYLPPDPQIRLAERRGDGIWVELSAPLPGAWVVCVCYEDSGRMASLMRQPADETACSFPACPSGFARVFLVDGASRPVSRAVDVPL